MVLDICTNVHIEKNSNMLSLAIMLSNSAPCCFNSLPHDKIFILNDLFIYITIIYIQYPNELNYSNLKNS